MIKQIQEDIKKAMKSGDQEVRNILRMIVSKSKDIAKNDENRDIESKDVLTAIKRQVKQNKETISYAQKEGRDTSKEENEISILEAYLPEKISLDEVSKYIEEIITSLEKEGENISKSIGQIMGRLKRKFGDAIDMKEANSIVRKLIDKK